MLSDDDCSSIEARVRRAVIADRQPGLHLLGHFLDFQYERRHNRACIAIQQGPHCTDENGEIDAISFGVFVDIALATSVRSLLKHYGRLATSNIYLQLSGIPLTGKLTATSNFVGLSQNLAAKRGSVQISIEGADGCVGLAIASFVLLSSAATTKSVRPALGKPDGAMPKDHSRQELLVLDRAEHAISEARAKERPFCRAFWGVTPRPTPEGAAMTVENDYLVANKVGHLQGGFQLGAASACAAAALGSEWLHTGSHASYMRPGVEPAVNVASTIVYKGNTSAVVLTKITESESRLIFQATSTHALRASLDSAQ